MINIRKSEPMGSRPCRYSLSLQDDSVFADFDINKNGNLYLVRISFDGYGCCYPDSKIAIGGINQKQSKRLIQLIESDNLNTTEASSILSSYLAENKSTLWEDALIEHELIKL